MRKNEHSQKAKQEHAEGQHGEKTQEAVADRVRSRKGDTGPERVAEVGSPYGATPSDGKHRLHEEREQHDEAEKNSELQKTNESDPAR